MTNHNYKLFLFLALVPLLHAQAMFYVSANLGSDSSDGSRDHPWRTLTRANSVSSPGGADIHVDAGYYPGPIALRNPTNGRLTFVSDTHWGAHIASSGSDRVVSIDGDSITFKGFEVTGDSTARLGILINGSNAIVEDNHVHHLPTATCTANGGAGIDSGSPTGHDNDILQNYVHDIGGHLRCSGIQGIYYANRGGHCTGNTVFRVPGAGIATWHGANSISITNNLVFAAGEDGILIGNGDSGAGIADHFLVTGNTCIYNGHYGITEFGKLVGTSNVYASNTLYGNTAGNYHLISGAVPTATITADF
jgi:hypothetical protein